MMPEPTRLLAGLRTGAILVLTLWLPGCADAPPVADKSALSPKGESESILAAETALREGDCRAAAENYGRAAELSSDPAIAAKAAQLAVGCNQLGLARTAAARWRKLAPFSGEAALTAALVALKRYDLNEARTDLVAWRDSGSAGNSDPLRFAELLERETDSTAVHRVFGDVLVGEDPTADVLLAKARLAIGAQDMKAAIASAQQALSVNADLGEAQLIVLRAQSVLGEHDKAIAGARALAGTLQGEDSFLLADLLVAAGRDNDARTELNRLGATPALNSGAERRLVALSMQEGDFAAAEARLEPLLGERGSTAMALYYLAQLAERRGDKARAIQNYRLLADSSLAVTARVAAARMMLEQGDTKNALALLDEYAAQNPDATIDMAGTRAQLLAGQGDINSALAGLDAVIAKYPDNPQLLYQRATVLETGSRTREAIAQFEQQLKSRPEDPQLTNALGYTLADHGQKLDRAEQLVRHALAVSPDSPAIQDSMGWVLFKKGRAQDALPILERAWGNSHDPEIAAHFGEALWKSGNEGRARYIWQQALNTDPTQKRLLATVARITGETPVAAPNR
jgi:tetratricopeptide (TPR) repeat protein